MGGGKPARILAGRPLAAHAADALGPVCDRVALVGKPGSEQPAGEGWEIWDDEPAEPRHPAAGIAHAIERSGGEVLVCAADMPFLTPGDARALVDAAEANPAAVAVVAAAEGTLQPVLGVYRAAAVRPLRDAAVRGEPLIRALEALDPVRVELAAAAVRSVDTDDELAAAERELSRET
jgi:molybdopterin-guanine dinucleotide biosynthesis protein A